MYGNLVSGNIFSFLYYAIISYLKSKHPTASGGCFRDLPYSLSSPTFKFVPMPISQVDHMSHCGSHPDCFVGQWVKWINRCNPLSTLVITC